MGSGTVARMVVEAPEHSDPGRRKRITPLQADRRPSRWASARRHVSTSAALVLAVVVGGFVLTAARTPAHPVIETAGDDVIASLDPVRTRTSAPRSLADPRAAAAPAKGPGNGDQSTQDLAVPVGTGRAIASSDQVPHTGGYTDLIRRYFGPVTVEAIVIVQCESGFDPLAVGTNTNGTQDHGLFQINDIHRRTFEVVTGNPWDHRYDPEVNTAFAAWLYDHADGWGPWRCNRNLATFDEPASD